MNVSRKRNRNSCKGISRAEALNCIPVKHFQVTETALDSGEMVIGYPVTARPWMVRFMKLTGKNLLPVQMRKLQLDELGTMVWSLINGQRCVSDIIRIFSETSQMHLKEAEVSVTRFLRELGKRGTIAFR